MPSTGHYRQVDKHCQVEHWTSRRHEEASMRHQKSNKRDHHTKHLWVPGKMQPGKKYTRRLMAVRRDSLACFRLALRNTQRRTGRAALSGGLPR